jgi:glycine/D-amino acid oxidase-like deaminating enzyme
MTTCDVLVVGGGLMGCATARELSSRGANVVVAEKNPLPGSETTARSGAIIRAHYGVPELVVLALEANKRYADFQNDTGHDVGWTNCGYAVLVDEDDVRVLESNVAMHQSLGVNVELLPPEDIRDMATALRTHDAALACYEPDGGFASPALTVKALSQLAQEQGARFLFNAPVVSAEKAAMVGAFSWEMAKRFRVLKLCFVPVTGRNPWGECSALNCPSFRCAHRSW